MEKRGVEIAVAHIVGDIIEYVPKSVVIKSILKKSTGTIIAVSIDAGETLINKIIPFETFIQIIDGNAEIIIDGISNFLNKGQSIVIPAHTSNILIARERFKIISTTIKSGYED